MTKDDQVAPEGFFDESYEVCAQLMAERIDAEIVSDYVLGCKKVGSVKTATEVSLLMKAGDKQLSRVFDKIRSSRV